MRAVWPADKPMSVRISAHDWVEGGNTPDDAVAIARAFKAAGADLIDVSSGQVSKAQKPVYGRMYQTPFADRSATRSASRRWRSARSARPTTSTASSPPAGRTCARWRGRTLPTRRGRCSRRRASATPAASAPTGRCSTFGQDQLERNLERERQLAAQTAGLSPQEQANLAQGV